MMWLGVAAIAAVYLLSGGGEKKPASYDEAVTLTLKNEGPWESQTPSNAKDSGNWYTFNGSRTFFGTSWGVTAAFVKDFLKVTPTPQYIRSIDKERAKYIYSITCYKWIRGSEIKNQYLLNLIFDWAVQAQGDLINALCDILNYSQAERYQIINTLHFSDRLIQDINNATPSVLHDQIKAKRLAIVPKRYPSFVDGVTIRINRYIFNA